MLQKYSEITANVEGDNQGTQKFEGSAAKRHLEHIKNKEWGNSKYPVEDNRQSIFV